MKYEYIPTKETFFTATYGSFWKSSFSITTQRTFRPRNSLQERNMSSLTFPTSSSIHFKISALEGGHLTLPERLLVTDADPEKKSTVPSLSFLIQHPSKSQDGNQKNQNIVFDLGVKRDLKGYMPAMQAHIANRQPVVTSPDVADALRKEGLDPAKDIDYVIMSHVHWDHVGTPADFEQLLWSGMEPCIC